MNGKRNKKKKATNAAMAFGIDKYELNEWKARAMAGEIAIITHYWLDEWFPDCDSVTKVACGDYRKLVQWGKAYGLKEKWIHERGTLSHFDLFGHHQRRVLLAEGLYGQWQRFGNDEAKWGGDVMQQETIIQALGVQPNIDPDEEYQRRKRFLKSYAKHVGANGFVLGISGGQDSTLLGKMAQVAVEELREEEKGDYQFIALRLPYGEQHDEDDASKALAFIQPDRTETVDIQPAVDASAKSFAQAFERELSDFHKGNTKARERMKVQYDVAATFGLLVIGTDHAAEAITGFFTKHGDGACDIVPLYGLNKRQGKALLRMLDAPSSTYMKTPTADLEDDQPGLSDEEALGLTYDEIDDFLEGKNVSERSENKLIHYYRTTEHKRRTPVSPQDEWWKNI